uniref:Uncharacterized protein n=1 Tax=Pectinophora gossypiella TaxID=13191 RepID=A0A1E1WI76_PECGO
MFEGIKIYCFHKLMLAISLSSEQLAMQHQAAGPTGNGLHYFKFPQQSTVSLLNKELYKLTTLKSKQILTSDHKHISQNCTIVNTTTYKYNKLISSINLM